MTYKPQLSTSKNIEIGTVVLGGGPVGSAIASILKVPVITDMVVAPKGPVYLYDTPQSRKFLDDVHHQSPKSLDIKIGYNFEGQVSSVPQKGALESYAHKTLRGETYTPKPFKYIPINWQSLMISCRRFIPKVHIDRIQGIDTKTHEMIGSRGTVYHYDRLISTIPAPVFAHLVSENWHLQYLPVVIQNVAISMYPGYKDWRKFDYVYLCDKDDSRYRYTRGTNERMGMVEKLIDFDTEKPNQYKIVCGEVPKIESVSWFGRFARWEEDRFIHDDIKDIYEEVYQ
jgi:hypothetical protein